MALRFLIAVLLLLAPTVARCGEVLDRLAATVNGRPLLQSDVEEELRYEFFAAKRSLAAITVIDQNQALDRLIDRELLLEQMQSPDFKGAAPEEVEKALNAFKTDYGTPDSWTTALAGYGIRENEVKSQIEAELNELRLIDLRLRPSIQIEADAIKAYYERQLVPKLPSGARTTLQEASPKIREILVQQKIDEALESWLQALRSQAKIQRFEEQPGGEPK
jgi:hypothetical protein